MAQRTLIEYEGGQERRRAIYDVPDAVVERDDARGRVRVLRAVLRQWAQDAATDAAAYDTLDVPARQAAQRRVIQRFGLLCDRLRDLLLVLMDEE